MERIITLTTDFGLDDHYVGSMKGVILSINPNATIVDITHNIARHDIKHAAFTINATHDKFPGGSIHVVVVDPGVGSQRKPIIFKTHIGVFIGPDNGVFTYIFKNHSAGELFEITNSKYIAEETSNTFHGRDIFAPVAAHISLGIEPSECGTQLHSPKLLNIPSPQIDEGTVAGEFIYQDNFGNLVSNISKELVEPGMQVMVGDLVIPSISTSYSDVNIGEILAIVGSSGFLEISVNQGSAAKQIKSHTVILSNRS